MDVNDLQGVIYENNQTERSCSSDRSEYHRMTTIKQRSKTGIEGRSVKVELIK